MYQGRGNHQDTKGTKKYEDSKTKVKRHILHLPYLGVLVVSPHLCPISKRTH